ncbi:MAG: hypothetical protein AB7L90_03000 [Hyphomicrobiaceae bacterium]
MRALSRRAGTAILAAVAVTLSLAARAETEDPIARILAETASQKQAPPADAGREHKVEALERPRPEEERRLSDEIDMLERARAEAEARRAAQSGADAPADAAREAATTQREQDERRGSAARRQAEERQRLEAARHAEAKRQAEDARRVAESQRREEERERVEEAHRLAEIKRKSDEARQIAEEKTRVDEAEYARMEAEREAEADDIDETLRKVREAWVKRRSAHGSQAADRDGSAHRAEALPPPYARTPVERAVASDEPDADDRRGEAPEGFRSATRVTILMVLEPGHRGIRRNNKTADPLLCGENGCYVGAGAGTPADLLPRRRAFGAARTLGERAGACRNSLGCVFRNVDLVSYPAVVQPIDMRLLRHDRREPHVLDGASRCRIDGGRLTCTPVVGPDYIMWVVPEPLAERAGPRELEHAVKTGLRSQSASIVIRD